MSADGTTGKLGAAAYSALVVCLTLGVSIISGLVLSTGQFTERVALAVGLFFNPPMLAAAAVFWGFLFLLLRRLPPDSVGWFGMWWRGALASVACVCVTSVVLTGASMLIGLVADDEMNTSAQPLIVGSLTLFYFGYIGGPVWAGIIAAVPLRFADSGKAFWGRQQDGAPREHVTVEQHEPDGPDSG